MKRRIGRTRAGRNGARDGVNLFFGALLGANLGTFSALKLVHYLELIAILAAMVMALRLVATAERRLPVLLLLGFYSIMLALFGLVPELQPQNIAPGDLHKLVGTMGVWVLLSLIIELAPVRDETEDGIDSLPVVPPISATLAVPRINVGFQLPATGAVRMQED